MSDIIKLLPDHVANQIAAGEVIQRPASVVKELLENAVDAGATEIKLMIREGGKLFIQVLDNGKGMSPSDARMCWERHATSKISKAEDIYNIHTMGFRGEALASIASVAMVELKTKREEDAVGTWMLIEGSEVKKQETVSYQNGTSITVKNLFYNIPARRNFLKSNPVETRHIMDEFMRIALANPDIAFSMYNNDDEVYVLKSGKLAQRVEQLFGYKTETLLPLEEQTTIVNVTGFIGKPENARKTRGEQYFFVNKRFIKDAYLNHAIFSCYEDLITKEQFPFYVIHIEIDPAQIDVNIHPTKTEIKFEDERAVYQIIKAVSKKALGQHYHVPLFDPASDDTFLNIPTTQKTSSNIERTSYQQTNTSSAHADPLKKNATKKDWQELFGVLQQDETVGRLYVSPSAKREVPPSLIDEKETQSVFQLHQSLIIAQIRSGIMLIDQQAAHERVLYEKYKIALAQHPLSSQQKLFPRSVKFAANEVQLLKEILSEIRLLGFDISELGGNTFVVNGVPAELDHHNEQELLMEMLESYKQQSYASFSKTERVARSMAKRAAIKAGTKLSPEEMKMLIDELFACPQPNYSPDGKACLIKMKMEDLYALFGKK